MSYLRFSVDVAIKQPIPQALQDRLPQIKAEILRLKSYAEKINTGTSNEENAVKATYHVCHHDEGGSCGTEIEI